MGEPVELSAKEELIAELMRRGMTREQAEAELKQRLIRWIFGHRSLGNVGGV